MWQDEGVFISLWGGVRGFRELANGMGSKENILGSKKKKKKDIIKSPGWGRLLRSVDCGLRIIFKLRIYRPIIRSG